MLSVSPPSLLEIKMTANKGLHRPRPEYKRTTVKRPLKERFWEKVEKTPTCWLWLGAHNGKYGKFWDGTKVVFAHRMAYELENGPTNQLVLHSCDVPLCVRPSHLFVGSQSDNIQDCIQKGRHFTPWRR